MLSILERNETERQTEKKPALVRLQQVLSTPPDGTVEGPAPAGLTCEGQSKPAMAGPAPISATPRVVPPLAPVPVPPAAANIERDDAGSPEFQDFAQQFARSFLDGISHAMKDAHALLTQDRQRMETALKELESGLRDMETVRQEVVRLRERVDALGEGRDQTSGRLGQIEDKLRGSSGAMHTLEEARRRIEERLELQAGAIRILHNTVHSRNDELGKLFSGLQALQTLAADATRPTALPADL